MQMKTNKVDQKFLKKISSKKCQKDMEKMIEDGFIAGKNIGDVITDISNYQGRIWLRMRNG